MERKNKLMLIAAIGAVAVLIASSAVRCSISGQQGAEAGAEQQPPQQAEGAPEEQGPGTGAMEI